MRSLRIGYPDAAGPGAPDVSLPVHFQPVRNALAPVTEGGKDRPLKQLAALCHPEAPDVAAGRGIRHIQSPVVRRERDAVRTVEVRKQQLQTARVWPEAIDPLDLLLLLLRTDAIGRIRKIQGAVTEEVCVVRAVERFACIAGCQCCNAAVFFRPGHGAAAVLAADQAALRVQGQSVGVVAGLTEHADAARGIPTVNGVRRDVGEEQSVSHPDRSLRELEIPCKLLHLHRAGH